MRTSHLLFLAVAFLVGCDQAASPSGPYNRIDMPIGKSDSIAGSNGPTSGPPDTTGNGSSLLSILDTVKLNGPLASNQLVGGQRRALVFYFPADRQLHILASSDGAVSGTYDRETVWDVTVTSQNVLYEFRTTPAEKGFRDTTWRDTNTNKYTRIRMHTDVASSEAKVQSDPGAILTVTVTAYSQIIPNAAASGVFPNQLPASVTGGLLFAGPSVAPIGTATFLVRLPAY